MQRFYRPMALIALILFVVLGVTHVAAMFRVVSFPIWIVVLTFPIIFAGQLVVIVGFKGGSLRAARSRLTTSQTFEAFFEAARHVPMPWRVFGLSFWYLYMPFAFFTRLGAGPGGGHEINEADQLAGVTVIFTAFALLHYLSLAYIIPNRRAILATVGVSDECDLKLGSEPEK